MFRIPFFTAVIVDFSIRTARTFTDFPEIVDGRNHVLFRDAALDPEIMRFFVIRLIGDIKLMRI